MRTIDLNADLGEGFPHDAALMPFVSSANIACGCHAGDADSIRQTIALCLQHGVAIGAHPSFNDRANFGRLPMQLSGEEIEELVTSQLQIMENCCKEMGTQLHHVKPHGALYNLSAADAPTAHAIAKAVYQFNPQLTLFGLSGSHSIAEGAKAGLITVSEVFADRSYQPDGSLTPRQLPNALIEDDEFAAAQAYRLASGRLINTVNGDTIQLLAQSICLHGDEPHALIFARAIYQKLQKHGIKIGAVTKA